MKFLADLHIHSRFSRATSLDLDPEHLSLWAQEKGITVIGTGDFTHPGWIRELQEKLVEADNGLYKLKPELEAAVEKDVPSSCRNPSRFILSGEISCIYKKGGQTRKIHHLILMPDFDSAVRFNKALDRIGNITSDGRPILGLDSRDLLEMALEASDRTFFIPAHIWTPWFSLFGSKSGFDEIEECFGDLTSHIHALETGLSSDPPMNRLLSSLDRYLLVSNSDAHSPSKLGREANIFDAGLDYESMINAMVSKSGFEGTIEFYPEEGKYHMDGHRKCEVMLTPPETREHNGLCPVCGKAITVGVLNRVEELADREIPQLSKPFYSLIPLNEILSEIYACGPATKKVVSIYDELISTLGPELGILMNADLKDIKDRGGMLLATAVERMRTGKVIRQEGYDGEYGVIRLFNESEKAELVGQASLFGIGKAETRNKKPAKPSKRNSPGAVKEIKKMEPPAFDDPILGPLNGEQRDAVLYRDGHLLITAGPGTGKTMTLTHRIAHIINSGLAAPDRILALTFTNKAAGEMKERIEKLLPEIKSAAVKVATFHGFCLDVLKEKAEKAGLPKDFTICSEEDSKTLARQIVSESGKGRQSADMLLRRLPQMKETLVTGEEFKETCDEIIPLFQQYRERLRGAGLLDLDDMELETLRLFREHPETAMEYSKRYTCIFVDEYQDTSPVQAGLLKMLVREGVNEICAIGDPDQAIYGFRGADVRNFHNFIETFPGSRGISLSKNYRSTQIILDGASRLLGKDAALEGSNGKGDPIGLGKCSTQSEEAELVVEQIERLLGGTGYFSLDSGRVASHEDGEGIGFGDIAVLYRLNSQGDAFEEALGRAGIPYARSGERPLAGRYPVNLIWRFLRAVHYPENKVYRDAYLGLAEDEGINVINILNKYTPEDTIENIIDQAVSLHHIDLSQKESMDAVGRLKDIARGLKGNMESLINALSLDRGIDHACLTGDRVALMSLHGAKGLEWPVVFITGCEDMLLPCSLFGDRDDEEEKRLLYVGMTRARKRLIISYAGKRALQGRVLETGPSPFLSLIPEDLCEPLNRNKWRRRRKKQEQLALFAAD
jgi:DNA helicase II / ATP-dependent DNA helicase PcrA